MSTPSTAGQAPPGPTAIAPSTARAATVLRPEIQALRAIAVLAVVLYHLWPARLPGGYVGVDVFFAISGFLIVGHLLREVASTGRVRLAAFWARRVRRLLPASLLVIAVTAVATLVWVPTVQWQQWFQEFGASAIYLQNWLLAANSVDYLGADNLASPVQHFWSLSVEEQFYIVWPIMIVLVVLLWRRHARRAVGIALAVVTVGSLAFSIWQVATDPAPAYFATQSRAWEFGLGGLLAFATSGSRERASSGGAHRRAAVSWLGIVALAVTVFVFTGATPFPGAAALLPVGATLAVIWAGAPAVAWAPSALFRLRPVRWLGDISYSFYLWHWGPIVVLPFVLGSELGTAQKLAIVVGAALAAWATKRFVEDPMRSLRGLTARPPVISIVSGFAVTAVLVAGCVGVTVGDTAVTQRSAVAIDAAVGSDCVGALAITQDCPRPYAVTALTDPTVARADIGRGVTVDDHCKQGFTEATLITCSVGDTTDPRVTLALVGDSHAGQYLEALDLYGASHGIRFVTMLKTWCNGSGASGITAPGATTKSNASCATWGSRAIDKVIDDPSIDGAVFSDFTRRYMRDGVGRKLVASDFTAPFQRIVDAGKDVVVLRDTPQASENAPLCVSTHLDTYDPCASSKADMLLAAHRDPLKKAVAAVEGASYIDLTDLFCGDDTCHAVIGGLVVYFDQQHMTAAFSRTAAALVGGKIEAALKESPQNG